MNIDHPTELSDYLKRQGLVSNGEVLQISKLEGGVSNRTILVELSSGRSLVAKQALRKLRVKSDWYSSPERIHREACALRWLMKIIPGNVPEFLHESLEHHIFIMTAVETPHTNWKSDLMNGQVVSGHAMEFARLLAKIHNSVTLYPELKDEFIDVSFFESLRLEPYYRFTIENVPKAKKMLELLILETRNRKQALVHGDYSPKNVLIVNGRLYILDYEVMHDGDPAFDVGFALTHFISKANHLPGFRDAFLDQAMLFWEKYHGYIHQNFITKGLEEFSILHTLGCLLARVSGRSPLEYLNISQREKQKRIALELMGQPPKNISELITIIKSKLYE